MWGAAHWHDRGARHNPVTGPSGSYGSADQATVLLATPPLLDLTQMVAGLVGPVVLRSRMSNVEPVAGAAAGVSGWSAIPVTGLAVGFSTG